MTYAKQKIIQIAVIAIVAIALISTQNIGFTPYAFVIENNAPTHSDPVLLSSSGNNFVTDTLTCANQDTDDEDGDDVANMFHFILADTSYENLIASFDTQDNSDQILMASSDDSGQIQTKDYSSYETPGTLNGALIPVYDSNCAVGGCYEYTGGNYISFADTENLDLGNEFTIEFWAKDGMALTNAGLVGKNGVYEISIVDNQLSATINGAITTTAAYQSGDWNHIALRKTAVAQELWLNGQKVAEDANTDSVANVDSELIIGKNDDDYLGRIDELLIYDRSISDAEILLHSQKNYNQIPQEVLQVGATWRCAVTPSDSIDDGETLFSNTLTIVDEIVEAECGSEEICGNSLDDNCDGLVDNEDTITCPTTQQEQEQESTPTQSSGGGSGGGSASISSSLEPYALVTDKDIVSLLLPPSSTAKDVIKLKSANNGTLLVDVSKEGFTEGFDISFQQTQITVAKEPVALSVTITSGKAGSSTGNIVLTWSAIANPETKQQVIIPVKIGVLKEKTSLSELVNNTSSRNTSTQLFLVLAITTILGYYYYIRIRKAINS